MERFWYVSNGNEPQIFRLHWHSKSTRQDLIDLLEIPNDYQVLFLQGGATLQFSMIPMKFGSQKIGDYALTGSWSKKAINEAAKIIDVNVVTSSESSNFDHVPNEESWNCSEDAKKAYLRLCAPMKQFKVTALFHAPPMTKAPLIADMSSVILSEQIDVSKFSVSLCRAQKILAFLSPTICIIKDSFWRQHLATSQHLQYAKHLNITDVPMLPSTLHNYL